MDNQKKYFKNIYYVLITICFIFTFTSFPFMSVGNISTSDKVLIVLTCYLILLLNLKQLFKLPAYIYIVLLLWIGFNFISSLNSENKFIAFAFSLNYLLQILLFFSFILVFRIYPDLKNKLLKFFYNTAVFISIIAIVEFFYFVEIRKYLVLFRQKNYEYGRVSSLFDNPNHLGVFLSIMFLVGLHYVFLGEGKKFLISNTIIFIAVLLSGTRMALIAILIGFVIYIYQTNKYKKIELSKTKKFSVNKKILLGSVSLFLILIIIFTSENNRLIESVEGLNNQDLTKVTGNRSYIWGAGFDIFLDYPLLGVGNGNFGQKISSIVGEAKTTHSLYISLLVENGVLGFFTFFTFIALIWLKNFQIKDVREKILFKTIIPIMLLTQITEMQLYNVFTFIVVFWYFLAIPFSDKKS